MVPGFNTDFKYRGQTFHVQTEDNGTANPVVVSLLYHKGAILASRKTSYRELLGKPDGVERLKEVMKAQHKALMREMLAGAYDAKVPGTTTPAESAKSATAAAATPRGVTPAPGTSEPSREATGLDAAIMRYLEDHAAAAAAR